MREKYDDMLFLPHYVSAVHPQMPRHDRAAQFSPFAALSGYDAVLQEAGRLTTLQKSWIKVSRRNWTSSSVCWPDCWISIQR